MTPRLVEGVKKFKSAGTIDYIFMTLGIERQKNIYRKIDAINNI